MLEGSLFRVGVLCLKWGPRGDSLGGKSRACNPTHKRKAEQPTGVLCALFFLFSAFFLRTVPFFPNNSKEGSECRRGATVPVARDAPIAHCKGTPLSFIKSTDRSGVYFSTPVIPGLRVSDARSFPPGWRSLFSRGSPVASRKFLANSFGLLDSIWMRAVSSSDRTFRSRHRTSVFSVTRPTPPFLSGHLPAK
jgi:hypothetical protein